MTIRLSPPAAGSREGSPASAALASASPTWRCRRCGAEHHFAGPVPAAAAVPCPGCGANTAEAVCG